MTLWARPTSNASIAGAHGESPRGPRATGKALKSRALSGCRGIEAAIAMGAATPAPQPRVSAARNSQPVLRLCYHDLSAIIFGTGHRATDIRPRRGGPRELAASRACQRPHPRPASGDIVLRRRSGTDPRPRDDGG